MTILLGMITVETIEKLESQTGIFCLRNSQKLDIHQKLLTSSKMSSREVFAGVFSIPLCCFQLSNNVLVLLF